MWWNSYGQLVDDSQEGAIIHEGAIPLPTYQNAAQYGDLRFAWDPANRWMGGTPQMTAPGYVTELLATRDRVRQGQAQPWEVEEYRKWEEQARSIPTRDISQLKAAWQGERQGTWGEGGWQEGAQDWWTRIDPGSPDVGPIMLQLRDKMESGQATPQERALYQQVYGMAADWDYRASVPQASDQFNPLGDQLFSALGVLGLGATGGLAAAPLFAGGAGLATTLGSLGTLSGIAGTGAGVLGQALDQPWLRTLGTALGAAGGIAGGVGGLANLASRGVSSLGDVGTLLSSVGKITGAAGRATGNRALGQAGSYLGTAGQVGSGVDTLSTALGQGNPAGLAAGLGRVAGGVMPLLRAAHGAQQPAQARPRPPQLRPPMPPQMPGPLLAADWLRTGPAARTSVLANLTLPMVQPWALRKVW